ncbi:hypothetical protein HZA98_03375 [Candidatus Woesearchaeota archaeon]|nr:hypothetical protein [Candidatus Woesearchaeota archaeon]
MGLEELREIELVKGYHITHHSYVDLIGLLKAIPLWFNEMNYDFVESGLSEKDIGTGYELLSEWKAERKVTNYLKYKIDLTINAKDLRKITLETGEETNWARVLITIDVTFVKDAKGIYKPYGWDERFRKLYEKYIIPAKIKIYIGKCKGEFASLTNMVKSFLK